MYPLKVEQCKNISIQLLFQLFYVAPDINYKIFIYNWLEKLVVLENIVQMCLSFYKHDLISTMQGFYIASDLKHVFKSRSILRYSSTRVFHLREYRAS